MKLRWRYFINKFYQQMPNTNPNPNPIILTQILTLTLILTLTQKGRKSEG